MPTSPPPAVSEAEKIHALPLSIVFNTLSSSVFCVWTVFGSVFLFYLQELGLPKSQIGALLSVFPFCGLLAPLAGGGLARWGTKRVCLVAYTARHAVIGLLLLLPWVLAAYGRGPAVLFVTAVLLVFAVLRAVAETAVYPWTQEFVPDRVRGRYNAVSTAISTLAAMGALAVAGYVIAHGSGMGRFVWLQGAGCVAGLIGTAFLLRVPGGAAAPPTLPHRPHGEELRAALCDANFRRFLLGTAGLSVGNGMVAAFMPLLLVERAGIQPGTVIWLDTAAMIGAIVVSLPCGWMADRFGSRTVLMPGLTMGLAISCFWLAVLALGKTALLGVPALALLGLLTGIANSAITLGSGRLLLTGVVPPDKSVPYTTVYYAWTGLTSGLAPLLAGGILTAVTAAGRSRAGMQVDAYTILFLLSLLPGVLGWLCFASTRPDGAFRTRDLLKRVARHVE